MLNVSGFIVLHVVFVEVFQRVTVRSVAIPLLMAIYVSRTFLKKGLQSNFSLVLVYSALNLIMKG